jgi:hypothetical protein
VAPVQWDGNLFGWSKKKEKIDIYIITKSPDFAHFLKSKQIERLNINYLWNERHKTAD